MHIRHYAKEMGSVWTPKTTQIHSRTKKRQHPFITIIIILRGGFLNFFSGFYMDGLEIVFVCTLFSL